MNRIFQNIPPVTKNLLIINILIFLVMMLGSSVRDGVIERYCALHYFTNPDFNPAQLFTYMFLHANFLHLFFNMFMLYMFGPHIEYSVGSQKFLFYYISCGIGAALVQMGVYAIMINHYTAGFGPNAIEMLKTGYAPQGMSMSSAMSAYSLMMGQTVGASGAIYGVLLAFGMMFPNARLMLLFPPMPVKAKWMVIGCGVLELLYGVSGSADNIAHFCHLGGMLIGLIIILYWRRRGGFGGGYGY